MAQPGRGKWRGFPVFSRVLNAFMNLLWGFLRGFLLNKKVAISVISKYNH
jgi:hypothetical protein